MDKFKPGDIVTYNDKINKSSLLYFVLSVDVPNQKLTRFYDIYCFESRGIYSITKFQLERDYVNIKDNQKNL
jgi:hypothetical protein